MYLNLPQKKFLFALMNKKFVPRLNLIWEKNGHLSYPNVTMNSHL